MRPACVAIVSPAWPPGQIPNGVVTYTAQLVPSLRALGVRAVVLAWRTGAGADSATPRTGGDDGRPLGVIDISQFGNVGRWQRAAGALGRMISKSPPASPPFAMIERAAAAAAERFPVELIEMEEAFGLAARVAALDRLPVVTRLHGPWFINGDVLGAPHDAEFESRVARERESIVQAAGVTSPSQDILARTRAWYGLPLEEARVIPYPFEAPASQTGWRLDRCDVDRIVFVGRFDRHKGADLILEAFAELAAQRPALRLDFVGPDRGLADGAGGALSLPEYLQRRIRDATIRSRIDVHGQLSPPQADELRRRGLVTCVPSRYETFGYTAVEAMSLGCPLVAARAGGLQEIVRHEETGLLFDGGDARSLAAQLERILSRPELGARLGEAARRDVHSRYHPATIAKETLDFYALTIERWEARVRARAGRLRPSE
jgi:glycosyltransferase involved in cell wall biosynthesis